MRAIFTLSQEALLNCPRVIKKDTIVLMLVTMLFMGFSVHAQLNVGDPGVTVDLSKLDADYPQMSRWANAGVRGGIPFITSFDKTSTVSSGRSAEINLAINALSGSLVEGEMGLLTIANGTYIIDASVQMMSNVSLIGESRDGVTFSITMTDGDAVSFNNVKNCGLYNLTIRGSWSEPKYDWNYSLDENREFTNSNVSVRLKSGTTDCWLDNVSIFNSANDPLRTPAHHNTFRNLIVDGCKRKAGGAEGYFFIQGRDNLITGCQITHLRHISLQGGNVEYNVLYDNDFRQEVSFHSGDNGNNLIEFNRITLPSDMPPIEAGETGPYPETENGKPIYFAIMGPWASMHDVSSHPNFVYRNDCKQFNHSFGSSTPWSNNDDVYYGPQIKGLTMQERIDNFPVYDKGVPVGSTLYAVNLEGGSSTDISVTEVSISLSSVSLNAGETVTLSETVLPENATNKLVTWSSDQSTIANVDSDGIITAISSGSTIITVTTIDGYKIATCAVTVTGESVPPTGGIYTETFTNMSISGAGTETYIGDYGFVWNVEGVGLGNGTIDGTNDIYFNRDITGVISNSIPGGISSLSVKCSHKTFALDGARTIELLVNGNVVGTLVKTVGNKEVYEFAVNDIDIAGDVVIAIRNATPADETNRNYPLEIDNITWTAYSVLSVNDYKFGYKPKIYPNPVSSQVTIDFLSTGTNKVEIFDLIGRSVYSSSTTDKYLTLNKNVFNGSGMYFIKIENDKKRHVEKIMVE
ncbi:Ig-like domain-containing protein [Formosa sp. PL04]|uniref:T9SS type A sorting domain-containing protein n=1 Tax=Formosa sp. PL04 TaxID=3081755 RepID=UPI002981D517|nr:Ig-like domain-containing protein [Formosa sp. PL04]MDW5289198.1 Ig-like domain-containing protein [Formosa sp. PL04]